MIRRGFWATVLNPFLYMRGVEAIVDIPQIDLTNIRPSHITEALADKFKFEAPYTSLAFWISHTQVKYIQMVGMIINLLFLLVALLLIFITMRYSFFRKVVISTHRGVYYPDGIPKLHRWYAMIQFSITVRGYRKQLEQQIYLRTPITYNFPESTTRIECSFTQFTWAYSKKRDEFILSSPVRVRAVRSDGYFVAENQENVRIPLENVKWEKRECPLGLTQNGYGEATVDIVGDSGPLLPNVPRG